MIAGNSSKYPVARYGSLTQTFHWLTALVVLVAFVYGLGGSESRVYAPARDLERQIHESLGMAVFALALLRMLWRAIDRQTPAHDDSPRWMMVAAKSMQGMLYLLLLAVPLTAIAGAWLEGHSLTLLGGVEILPKLSLAHDLGATIADLHTILGDALIWLAGLHAVAALYHHLYLRDGVLVSMLPSWVRAPKTPVL